MKTVLRVGPRVKPHHVSKSTADIQTSPKNAREVSSAFLCIPIILRSGGAARSPAAPAPHRRRRMTFPPRHVKARCRADTHTRAERAGAERREMLPRSPGDTLPSAGRHRRRSPRRARKKPVARSPESRVRSAAAAYLAAGVFCQIIEDKGREFLI